MKKIMVLIIFMLLLIGCSLKTEEDTKMYSQDEMLNYVENIGYNLKGRYEIINSTNEKLLLRIKNTQLDFEVWQEFECTNGYSKMGICDKKAYSIHTNYLAKATEYFINDYQQSINYNNQYCYKTFTDTECNRDYYNIDNKEDISSFTQYMNGFLNYLNNQIANSIITDYTLKFSFFLYFNNSPSNSLLFSIQKENGQFVYNFNDDMTDNNDLLSHINNYIIQYNPFMELNYNY